MRIQFIRNRGGEGAIIGIALVIGQYTVGIMEAETPAPKPCPDFWRTCDNCTANEAMVFCKTHTVYLCESCLSLHKPVSRVELCWYLSMASAREMIIHGLKHEAHT